VIADKGYDSQTIVDAVKSKGAEPVIPARFHRKTSRDYDRYIYKERNAIERMFIKSSILGESQLDTTSWASRICRSCM